MTFEIMFWAEWVRPAPELELVSVAAPPPAGGAPDAPPPAALLGGETGADCDCPPTEGAPERTGMEPLGALGPPRGRAVLAAPASPPGAGGNAGRAMMRTRVAPAMVASGAVGVGAVLLAPARPKRLLFPLPRATVVPRALPWTARGSGHCRKASAETSKTKAITAIAISAVLEIAPAK